jgi:hypothetical protein
MRFPPKLVSVLCSVQALIVVMTYVLTGSFRKAMIIATAGRPYTFDFPLGLRIFCYCGPLLLLVPLIWGYLATTRAEIGQGFVVISEKQGWIGWATTAGLAIFCGWILSQAFVWAFVVPFAEL